MTRAWLSAFTAAVVMVMGGQASVGAQTSAVGPYYAEPAWDQKLPAATRFIVLSNWNSEAVLDRETGLVWERAPDSSVKQWPVASAVCALKTVGGRMGWRLPSIQELASITDPSVPSPGPALPAGHPFTVTVGTYWSATRTFTDPTRAYAVVLSEGGVAADAGLTFPLPGWCVRGGSGGESQ